MRRIDQVFVINSKMYDFYVLCTKIGLHAERKKWFFPIATSIRNVSLFISLNLNLFFRVVRMAERSKAPDSRIESFPWSMGWAFWSPNGGVGSNPTSDTTQNLFFLSFILKKICRIFLYPRLCYIFIFYLEKWNGGKNIKPFMVTWGHFALSYQISNRLRDVSQTPGTLELAEKKMKIFSNQNKCGKFSYKGAVELRSQSTPSISILGAKVLYRYDTSLGRVSRKSR